MTYGGTLLFICNTDLCATDFGIKPAIADIIEYIMAAEDKLDQANPASGAAPEL